MWGPQPGTNGLRGQVYGAGCVARGGGWGHGAPGGRIDAQLRDIWSPSQIKNG